MLMLPNARSSLLDEVGEKPGGVCPETVDVMAAATKARLAREYIMLDRRGGSSECGSERVR